VTALRADPPPKRFRVARARLAYIFERYAIREELITIAEGSTLLGLTREAIALLVLQGRLAVAEAVKEQPEERPPRMLIRAEVEAIKQRTEQGTLPFSAK
jgi:hypothetical protein